MFNAIGEVEDTNRQMVAVGGVDDSNAHREVGVGLHIIDSTRVGFSSWEFILHSAGIGVAYLGMTAGGNAAS